MPWTRNGICVCFEGKPAETIWIFFKVLRFYRLHPKNDKKNNEKGLTKLISLNSVRPFCWFHTYYLITTRFRINNAKISRVIILLSNRTLSALKCPVYKGFQKIFIIQTPYRLSYFLCLSRFLLSETASSRLFLFIIFSFQNFRYHSGITNGY